jgi:hypothetical protein
MCLLDPFGGQAGRGDSVARTMVPRELAEPRGARVAALAYAT